MVTQEFRLDARAYGAQVCARYDYCGAKWCQSGDNALHVCLSMQEHPTDNTHSEAVGYL